MRYLLLFFLFILNLNIQSEQNIKVVYQAHLKNLPEKPDQENSQFWQMKKMMHEETQLVLPQVRFDLIASRERYNFFYEPIMPTGDRRQVTINKAISSAMDGKMIYNDEKNNSYYIPRSLEFTRKVKSSNVEWKITNKSKEILGFKCYKAVAEMKDKKSEYGKLIPIEAWFSPDLNYRGGPTAYATLPGTILELNMPAVTFKAIKVQLGKFKLASIVLENLKVKTHKEFVAYYNEWSQVNMPQGN